MAYVIPQLANERRTTYKRCIYDNPLRMANNGAESFDFRIVRKRRHRLATRMDKYSHQWCIRPLKSTCHVEINDIVPTNDRLAAIHLKATSACSSCGQAYSIQLRITDCGEGPIIWNWTRKKTRDHTPNGPQIYNQGMDDTSRLQIMAKAKVGSNSTDPSSSRPLPPTVPPATIPLRFSGLHAAVQMETEPTHRDAPFHREVPGGTRVKESLR